MTAEERRLALEDLCSSAGWLLFKEHARKQWGPEGYGRKVSAAMACHQDEPVKLASELQKVHATTEEINALIRWPEDAVAKLHDATTAVSVPLYRGGR